MNIAVEANIIEVKKEITYAADRDSGYSCCTSSTLS